MARRTVIVTDTLLTAKCLQLLSYKKRAKSSAPVPANQPPSGTTLFPHVIQGHGQLAESPLCDRLFVMIMHLVIHQTLLPWKTKREKQSVNRKKAEQGKQPPEMERLQKNILAKNAATQKQHWGGA